jgi:hypothetical protein
MYYTLLETINDHIVKAKLCLQPDITFAAKAHKKEAMQLLNAAYDRLKTANTRYAILSLSREDNFSIPHDLFQIRDKHFRLFMKDYHEDLKRLVQLRSDFKNIKVVKVGA